MTKQEAFDEINRTQDEYIDKLIKMIYENNAFKTICFNSPTGTGKTKMMAKLINKMSDYYFIITTLSKSKLHEQTQKKLEEDCDKDNFKVYGSAEYKSNSKLQAEQILSNIPLNKKCIWLRDEGHIKTNKFEELLIDRCFKVINFSATNVHSDIQCNFTHTMMLRTVNQTTGTPADTIKKLIEIKEQHKSVPNYNPCAIFRCVSGDDKLYNLILKECEKYNLKHIDITNNYEDNDLIEKLCKDDNEYDVIINKQRLVEGIDIRRAHVLYMDNQPSNNATTIQVIGRCRRNALLYRTDIDIFAIENEQLLKDTRECYVYYNVNQMRIDKDENGELQSAFCNYISCEELKPNITISVVDGQLPNGLFVIELKGHTGDFRVSVNKNTGCNIIEPKTPFYDVEIRNHDNYIYIYPTQNHPTEWKRKIHIENIPKLPLHTTRKFFDYSIGEDNEEECEPYYILEPIHSEFSQYKDDEEYPDLFEDITEDEKYLLESEFTVPIMKITQRELKEYKTYKYKKIYNDNESAIVGVDLMHQIKDDENNVIWCESKSVSSKINCYNKFNRFLTNRYKKEIEQAKVQCFNGSNKTKIHLNKRCMSVLGYCVEYYSKYLVYGRDYLARHIIIAQKESHTDIENEFIIVRACMLKYKEMLTKSFGKGVSKVIKIISVQELIKDEYKNFVQTVVELAEKTSDFVKNNLYPCQDIIKDDIDPNLSIKHITGLADYITKDTILDVKVRNNIDLTCVKQVLAYHYLSTKRSDLDIKRVIIYDATSGKYISIDISEDNRIKNDFTDTDKLTQCNVITTDFGYKKQSIPKDNRFKFKSDNDFSRIGEIQFSNNGQKMQIVAYKNCNDIDIQFEDGTIVKNRRYREFIKGGIINPNFNEQKFIKIGETNMANNGQKMTIIAYRSFNDIDIKFEDGTIITNKEYRAFQNGLIRNPQYRLGETNINNNGQKMTIVNYRNANDIDVEFEDGAIVKNTTYNSFIEGIIRNPNVYKNRIGETIIAFNGEKMTIIAYRSFNDIDVEFEDGTIVTNKSYGNFKKGMIKKEKNKLQHLGEVSITDNKKKEKITIVAYRNAEDIDVKFEDGTIVTNKSYYNFQMGKIGRHNKHNQRIGETNIANNGEKMTIIAYRNAKSVDIKFEDGTVVVNKSYNHFKAGKIAKRKEIGD